MNTSLINENEVDELQKNSSRTTFCKTWSISAKRFYLIARRRDLDLCEMQHTMTTTECWKSIKRLSVWLERTDAHVNASTERINCLTRTKNLIWDTSHWSDVVQLTSSCDVLKKQTDRHSKWEILSRSQESGYHFWIDFCWSLSPEDRRKLRWWP
jgi:hypothetical protein